jgi:hypothetical protein
MLKGRNFSNGMDGYHLGVVHVLYQFDPHLSA